MRRLVIALLASTALIGTASAADLARKSIVSAPVVVAPNWTGFYVGGFVGYGWGGNDWTVVDDPIQAYSPDFDGFLGGLQIGYDYQFGNNFVLGIQADIAWASLDGSKSYSGSYIDPDATGSFSGTVKTKAEWISTLTARIGFAADHALFYIKGGAAWADLSHSNEVTDRYDDGATITVTNFSGSKSNTRSGWTLGAGVEYLFAPNWSLFLEYDYYDFGDKNIVIDYGPWLDTYKIDTNVSAVKIGVNYRFGGPTAVSARY